MESFPAEARAYLEELNVMSKGDPEAQVSMYEVGSALGLEKTEAGQMAETLFMGGYAELKTLSGGIGITALGLSELGLARAGVSLPSLGSGPVVDKEGGAKVTALVTEIKTALASGKLSAQGLEAAFTDIKTLEVQLLSPFPKTYVVRAVFRSLSATLVDPKFSELKACLDHMIEN